MAGRAALLVIAMLVIAVGALIWYLQEPVKNPAPPAVSAERIPTPPADARPVAGRRITPPPAQARALSPSKGGIVLPPEAAELARTLNTPTSTPEQDVQTLSTLIELFRRANLGANPAGGLSEEIVEQLLGKNLRHFAVLPADCPGLANLQLLDRWGTPYFLHPLSREIVEIRSAGPDRKMGTPDDIFLNDEPAIRR